MTALQRQPNGDRDHLSATIHFLGDLLGNVIREQAGAPAFDLEEQVRGLAKDLRAITIDRPDAAERIAALQAEIQRLVAGLSSDQMRDLIASALPDIERCLPDWSAVKAGKPSVVIPPAPMAVPAPKAAPAALPSGPTPRSLVPASAPTAK